METGTATREGGLLGKFLNGIEKAGNKLPDPDRKSVV